MKEATGELNMTVIAVVAIAAVGAFFYAFVWPALQNNIKLSNACSTASSGEYFDKENKVYCNNGTCYLNANSKGATSGPSKKCVK